MRKNKTLRGRVSNQEATETETVAVQTETKFPEFARVENDTFKITVKDDNEEVVYTNPEEPFSFPQYDSLADHMRARGANLSDDQITFLGEALKGIGPELDEKEGIVPADVQIVQDLNALLKAEHQRSQYSRVFNSRKPVTDENVANATAGIVRNFIRQQKKAISDETAITTLQEYGVIPKEYTLAEFRSNKGKR